MFFVNNGESWHFLSIAIISKIKEKNIEGFSANNYGIYKIYFKYIKRKLYLK